MIGAEKECTLGIFSSDINISSCPVVLIYSFFFILAAVESKLLKARIKMQQKYIDQFHMLYDDFNITKLPLLSEEVSLRYPTAFLVQAYNVCKCLYMHFLGLWCSSSTKLFPALPYTIQV